MTRTDDGELPITPGMLSAAEIRDLPGTTTPLILDDDAMCEGQADLPGIIGLVNNCRIVRRYAWDALFQKSRYARGPLATEAG